MYYVGFTLLDPKERDKELSRIGRFVSLFQVKHKKITYERAYAIEKEYRNKGYLADPLPPKVKGSVYSLYTFQY